MHEHVGDCEQQHLLFKPTLNFKGTSLKGKIFERANEKVGGGNEQNGGGHCPPNPLVEPSLCIYI